MFAKGWSQSRLSSRVSKWRCMFTGLTTNVSGLLFLPIMPPESSIGLVHGRLEEDVDTIDTIILLF